MTVKEQQRWVEQEIARCLHCLKARHVIGWTIIDKARDDLAALRAIAQTLREADAPLLQTRRSDG